jgi:hypothetical protein
VKQKGPGASTLFEDTMARADGSATDTAAAKGKHYLSSFDDEDTSFNLAIPESLYID